MFRVTYEIISPESAVAGDAAERGFLDRGGNRIAALVGRPTPGVGMSLREAARLISAGFLEDSGRWFTEMDPRRDYTNGNEEYRALHPPENVTPSSYARLRRLVTSR